MHTNHCEDTQQRNKYKHLNKKCFHLEMKLTPPPPVGMYAPSNFADAHKVVKKDPLEPSEPRAKGPRMSNEQMLLRDALKTTDSFSFSEL
jgi:hypothetical protein